MAWPGNLRCPVACLEMRTWQKEIHDAMPFGRNRRTTMQALSITAAEDEVWFCNVPMGKHKLENLLTEMCKKAGHVNRAVSRRVVLQTGKGLRDNAENYYREWWLLRLLERTSRCFSVVGGNSTNTCIRTSSFLIKPHSYHP